MPANITKSSGNLRDDDHSTASTGDTTRSSDALPFRILWSILGFIFAALLLLASTLLIRSGIFSAKEVSDEQAKALWAFLGVSFGAVVTLVGALLTEQNNRRTAAITREAAERSQIDAANQYRLAEETEQRLVIDTVAKVLELTTQGSDYAKPARVAGAIATLVQLRGGSVAVRILGELWKDDAVDSDTAVWLINQILRHYETNGSGEEDVVDAATLLSVNASKLLPPRDRPDEVWYMWPDSVSGRWPSGLPEYAKTSLLWAAARFLGCRDPAWWRVRSAGNNDVIGMLRTALDDFGYSRTNASSILMILVESGLEDVFEIDDDLKRLVTEASDIVTIESYRASSFSTWATSGGRDESAS